MSYKNFLGVYAAQENKRVDWFKISAKVEGASNIAYLEIFDVITPYGGNDLISQIKSMKADEIRLFINSPGGDVFTGFNIYNTLKSIPAKVTTYVTGLAASAASIIALAGNEIIIYENSFIMCHQAWGFAIGNADEMLSTVGILEKLDNAIVDIYANKTGKDKGEILTMMKAETWFNSAEALTYGLVNTVLKDEAAKGAMAFDLSVYANAPDILMNITNKELMNKVKEDLEADQMDKKRKQMLKRLALTEVEL
jgi:ATP-dependent Clp endopeptidase proteolytic subunit ClpP